MNIYILMQGGLTLGAKDYYLNNDAATVAIREAYKTYLIKMFQLYGFSADEAAKKLLPYSFTKQRSLLSQRAVPNFVILRPTTTR